MTDTHTVTPTAPKPASTPKPRKAKGSKPAKRTKKLPRSIVPASFKARYAENDDTCGSRLTMALKEATTTTNKDGRECLDVPALFAIAKANKIDVTAYKNLNNGQKRMNVYNKMRGLLQQGQTIKVGSQSFSDAKKALKAA